MKIEMLVCLVLRLIVGGFMLIHALYNVVTFGAFTLEIERYISSAKVLDNTFFSIAAPLFPFLEFLLGALLLFGLFYKKTVFWTLSLFTITAAFLYTAEVIPFYGIAIVLAILCFYLYLRSDMYKKVMYPSKSLHNNITLL